MKGRKKYHVIVKLLDGMSICQEFGFRVDAVSFAKRLYNSIHVKQVTVTVDIVGFVFELTKE